MLTIRTSTTNAKKSGSENFERASLGQARMFPRVRGAWTQTLPLQVGPQFSELSSTRMSRREHYVL